MCLSSNASVIKWCKPRYVLNQSIFCMRGQVCNSCIWVRLVGACIPFYPFQNATLMDPHFPMFMEWFWNAQYFCASSQSPMQLDCSIRWCTVCSITSCCFLVSNISTDKILYASFGPHYQEICQLFDGCLTPQWLHVGQHLQNEATHEPQMSQEANNRLAASLIKSKNMDTSFSISCNIRIKFKKHVEFQQLLVISTEQGWHQSSIELIFHHKCWPLQHGYA